MHDDYDAAYYRKREATARGLADKSSDPGVADIHLRMAEEYARKALVAERPTLKLGPSR